MWSQKVSLFNSSEGLFQRGKGGPMIIRRFYNKNQVVSQNIKRLLLKKKNRPLKLKNLALFFVWEDARAWLH